jgi:5'-deoxynucleotidase YfbR-like HD superfamily hydrolase
MKGGGDPMLDENESTGVVDAILGMSAVKRYHGRNTIKTQTLADHSARVAQLSFFLALEFYEGDYAKANYVSTLGLFHDFPESLLECDVPTPVKMQNGIGMKLKSIETDAVRKLFPDDVYLQNLCMEVASEDDFNLMKLADLLDLGLYVWEEMQLGNKTLDFLWQAFIKLLDKQPANLQNLKIVMQCRAKLFGQTER